MLVSDCLASAECGIATNLRNNSQPYGHFIYPVHEQSFLCLQELLRDKINQKTSGSNNRVLQVMISMLTLTE